MKKAPQLWKLQDLPGMKKVANEIPTITEVCIDIDGYKYWMPARPLGDYSIINRIKLAWMVFTGKADALIWPGNQ